MPLFGEGNRRNLRSATCKLQNFALRGAVRDRNRESQDYERRSLIANEAALHPNYMQNITLNHYSDVWSCCTPRQRVKGAETQHSLLLLLEENNRKSAGQGCSNAALVKGAATPHTTTTYEDGLLFLAIIIKTAGLGHRKIFLIWSGD